MWNTIAGVDRSVDWCNENHLHINAHKAEHILFDPRSTEDHCSVDIHGHDIRQVSTYKYSGVHIVCELSWHTRLSVQKSIGAPFSDEDRDWCLQEFHVHFL